jgi:hypothetical protein
LYGTDGAAGIGAPGTVPLELSNNRALIELSVDGGPTVPVAVDSGSTGLVIPLQDIGLMHLGLPTGMGIKGYAGEYFVYATFDTTVNFGNGMVTAPTPIDVALLTFPFPFHTRLSPGVGVLGVAEGSGPGTLVSTALRGDLNEGVLINEPQGYLQFGPNPLPARVSVPTTDLFTPVDVSVNGGTPESVNAAFDSGATVAWFPSSVVGPGQLFGFGLVPPGTTISVYTSDDQTLLY